MKNLLLLSNSRDAEGRWLEYPRDAIRELLGDARSVAFVPYAGVTLSWDDYAARLAGVLGPMGYAVNGVHRSGDPAGAVRAAEAIAVGGGNTFHLLREMQRTGVLDAVRERALAGVPYLGWSAGSVIACPTIRTTNDMPIVEPATLSALGLIPFQINAHYTDWHAPGFQGETRRERLAEFLVANPGVRVVGLPEGGWIRVRGAELRLGGGTGAVGFAGGKEAWAIGDGEELSALC